MIRRVVTLTLLALALCAAVALAQDACSNRGDLDKAYCDENKDLVADPPVGGKCQNPGTLVFTYTPVEDPAVYKDLFDDFQAYLSKATGKKVVYYSVQSNAAEVEAMRSGRLHIAGFSTGPNLLRREPGRLRAHLGQGLRGQIPGLQPDRGGQEGQPLPEARGPEGQAAGPHRGVLQFRQPGPPGPVPQAGTGSGQGLHRGLLRQARPVPCWAWPTATTTPPPWPRTSTSA